MTAEPNTQPSPVEAQDQSPNPPEITSGLTRMAEIFEREMQSVHKKMAQEKVPGAPESVADEPAVKPVEEPAAEAPKTEPQAAPEPEQPAQPSQPAAEPTPEAQLDQPPASMSKAGKENWNRLVAAKNLAIEKAQKEAAELREKLKSLETNANTLASPELEAIRKQNEELQSQLERVALEQSPKFKGHYESQIQKQIKVAKAVSGEYADEVAQLLLQPRSAERNARLMEIRNELGIEGEAIGKALVEITAIKQEREEQLANHRENLKILREAEAREAAQTEQRRRAVMEKTLAEVRKLPEFTPGNDPKQQAFVRESLDFIQNAHFGRLGEEDQAMLPAMAMKGAYLQQFRVPELEAKVKALEARISQLNSASPKVSTSAPAQPASRPLDPGRSSFIERFEKAMRGE